MEAISVFDRSVQLVGGPYVAKDQRKLELASHYVYCGSAASSSRKYWDQLFAHEAGNTVDIGRAIFNVDHALYVSVEGARRGRYAYNPSSNAWQAVDRFLSLGCVVIADNEYDRRRPYNVGERELEAHLISRNAVEFKPGMWHVRPTLSHIEVSAVRQLIGEYVSDDRDRGFCAFATKAHVRIELFDWAMREWPKSASLIFPVPDPEHVTLNYFTKESREKARYAYHHNLSKLEGEYGTLRCEMLDFVRERLALAL